MPEPKPLIFRFSIIHGSPTVPLPFHPSLTAIVANSAFELILIGVCVTYVFPSCTTTFPSTILLHVKSNPMKIAPTITAHTHAARNFLALVGLCLPRCPSSTTVPHLLIIPSSTCDHLTFTGRSFGWFVYLWFAHPMVPLRHNIYLRTARPRRLGSVDAHVREARFDCLHQLLE